MWSSSYHCSVYDTLQWRKLFVIGVEGVSPAEIVLTGSIKKKLNTRHCEWIRAKRERELSN